VVTGDLLQKGAVELFGEAVSPRVLVAEGDAERARALAVDFDRQISSPENQDDEEPEPLPLAAWPLCDACGKQRLAVCPICETSGTDFPRADDNLLAGELDESSEHVPVALICTSCDEPWIPGFLRVCEWCGHNFGEGVARSTTERRVMPEEEEEFNSRTTFVMLVLLVIFLLLMIYFSFVTNG
jgi:hypothetical protein